MERRRAAASILVAVALCASTAQAAPGDLDTTFGRDIDPIYATDQLGPGITRIDVDAPVEYVNARGLAVQSDGRIVAVFGEGSLLHRFLPSGLPDPEFGYGSFGEGGFTRVGSFRELRDAAVQPDGRILGVGIYQGPELPPNANHYASLVRVLADGSLDATFGVGGFVDLRFSRNEELLAVNLQTDGKIVAAGRTRLVKPRWTIRRLLSDGSVDRDFASGGKLRTRPNRNGGYPLEILSRGDGRLVAAGVSSSDTDLGDVTLVACDGDGRRERQFGSRGHVLTHFNRFDIAYGAALQSDGRVVVAASTQPGGGDEQWILLRYLDDGSLDPTFGTDGVVTTDFGGEAEAYAVAVQPDGKIVAAGEAEEQVALARYHADGTLDAGFGVGGLVRTAIAEPGIDFAEALAIALQADGRILVAGAACREIYADCPVHFLARYEGN